MSLPKKENPHRFILIALGGGSIAIAFAFILYTTQLYSISNQQYTTSQQRTGSQLPSRPQSDTSTISTEDDPENKRGALREMIDKTLTRLLQENDGNRIVLTRQNQEFFLETIDGPIPRTGAACLIEFNADSANTRTTYENNEYGINMQLPYNESWGNYALQLKPFYEPYEFQEIYFNNVDFGPMDIFYGGGCGWHRRYTIRISAAQSFDTTLQEINEESKDWINLPQPVVKKINNIQTLSYSQPGKCGANDYMFIAGPNYSLELSAGCEANTSGEKTADIFEAIVNSIRNTR